MRTLRQHSELQSIPDYLGSLAKQFRKIPVETNGTEITVKLGKWVIHTLNRSSDVFFGNISIAQEQSIIVVIV